MILSISNKWMLHAWFTVLMELDRLANVVNLTSVEGLHSNSALRCTAWSGVRFRSTLFHATWQRGPLEVNDATVRWPKAEREDLCVPRVPPREQKMSGMSAPLARGREDCEHKIQFEKM